MNRQTADCLGRVCGIRGVGVVFLAMASMAWNGCLAPAPSGSGPESLTERGAVPASIPAGSEVASTLEQGLQAENGRNYSAFALVPGGQVTSGVSEALERLGAHFALLADSDLAAEKATPGGVPIVSWTRISRTATEAVVLEYGRTARVVILPESYFAASPAGIWPEAIKRTLQQLGRDRGRLTLVLPASVWQGQPQGGWEGLGTYLAGLESAAVISLGGDQLTWWMDNQVEFLSLPSTPPALPGGSMLIWVCPTRVDKRFSLVKSESVAGLQRFERTYLKEKDALQRGFACTPVISERPETTVRFRNPLSRPLEVRPEWRFAASGVGVDPQVLSFQLAGGGTYEQTFTFSYNGPTPFKFLRPELLLTTDLGPEAGIFTMRRSLWCGMRGKVDKVSAAPRIDGDLAEWTAQTHPVNHAAQVVEGAELWQGPSKLSATFSVANDDTHLYVGVRVVDSQGVGGGQAVLYVDLNASKGPLASLDPNRLLKIRATRAGAVIGEGADAGLMAAVMPTDSGYHLEVAIPSALFEGGKAGDEIRLDLAVLGAKDSDGKRAVLYYSGNRQNDTSSLLYGRFSRVASE